MGRARGNASDRPRRWLTSRECMSKGEKERKDASRGRGRRIARLGLASSLGMNIASSFPSSAWLLYGFLSSGVSSFQSRGIDPNVRSQGPMFANPHSVTSLAKHLPSGPMRLDLHVLGSGAATLRSGSATLNTQIGPNGMRAPLKDDLLVVPAPHPCTLPRQSPLHFPSPSGLHVALSQRPQKRRNAYVLVCIGHCSSRR